MSLQRGKRIYALSIKQPWASLVVHGIKPIEVRRWLTHRRGRILIHTGRISDDREFAWQQVPAEIVETAKLRGGIIGAVDLVECIPYRKKAEFTADCSRHLNDPDWFVSTGLYGFYFKNAEQLPFRRFTGNVRFFTVPAEVAGADGSR